MLRTTVVITIALGIVGCSAYDVSQTGRRFTDQAVSTVSIRRAVEEMPLSDKIRGKTVYVDPVSAGAQDAAYLARSVELNLMQQGATVVKSPDDADFILVLIIEAAGTDVGQSNIQVPIPFAGSGAITFYSHVEQKGYARVRPFLYARDEQGTIEELGKCEGKSRYKRMRIVVFDVTSTDIYKDNGEFRLTN